MPLPAAAARAGNDWLVKQCKPVICECLFESGYPLHLALVLLHATVTEVCDLHPVASGLLGDITGCIRGTHDTCDSGRVLVYQDDADTRTQAESLFSLCVLETVDGFLKPGSKFDSLPERTVLQQPPEFITAQATQCVALPDCSKQQLCYLSE